MQTPVQILNYGLGKIGASTVNSINPPRTSLERHCERGYGHWRNSELAKRRWVFATALCVPLTMTTDRSDDDVERPYGYQLPTDCLRPIRGKRTEWVQSGRELYSMYNTLSIDYVRDVVEADFDPLFVDVLAWRIAMECVEYATQSNTKNVNTTQGYADAVAAAGKNNAYVIGPETLHEQPDHTYEYLAARY